MFLNAGRAAIAGMAIAIVVELVDVPLVLFAPLHYPAPTRFAIAIVRAVVIACVVIALINNGRRLRVDVTWLVNICHAAVAGVVADLATGQSKRRGTHRGHQNCLDDGFHDYLRREPSSYDSASKTVNRCKGKATAPRRALPRKPRSARALTPNHVRIIQIGVWNGRGNKKSHAVGVIGLLWM